MVATSVFAAFRMYLEFDLVLIRRNISYGKRQRLFVFIRMKTPDLFLGSHLILFKAL